MNTQTLNEFLSSKGCSTDSRVKKNLATALGIPCDPLGKERETELLQALKIGSAAIAGKTTETYRIEIASFDGEEKPHNCDNLEDVYPVVKQVISEGKQCRTVKVTTITEIVK